MTRRVFGESVRGASHIRNGRECQDSLKKVEKDENTLILAVADGHGSDSCPYSKTGSEVAVNVFCKIMGDYLETYAGEPELLLTFLKREGDTKVAQAIDAEWKRRILKLHSKYKREIISDSENNVTDAEHDITDTEDNVLDAESGVSGIGRNKDKEAIYRMYGSTLIGLVITNEFLFAFQLGDGDIVKVSEMGVQNIIEADKILGTETHSLSKAESWKKAITFIKKQEENEPLPIMYMLSSDGMANSYKNDDEFKKTCSDYFDLLKEHGAKAVSDNLKAWLSETSELGCGDDITALFAYFGKGDCLV